MSQLLLGLLIPIGGAAVVSLIVSLMSRYVTEGLGMKIGYAMSPRSCRKSFAKGPFPKRN
jgi:hypothetical protein